MENKQPKNLNSYIFKKGLITGLFVSVNAILSRILQEERRIMKVILFTVPSFSKGLSVMDSILSFIAIFVLLQKLRYNTLDKSSFKSLYDRSIVYYLFAELTFVTSFAVFPTSYNLVLLLYLLTNLQKFILEYHAALFLQRLADLVLSPRLKEFVTEEESHSMIKGKATFVRQTFIFMYQAFFFGFSQRIGLPISIVQCSNTLNKMIVGYGKILLFLLISNHTICADIEDATEQQMKLVYEPGESLSGVTNALLSKGLANTKLEVMILLLYATLTVLPKSYLKMLEAALSLKGLKQISRSKTPTDNYGKAFKELFDQASRVYPGIYIKGFIVSIFFNLLQYLCQVLKVPKKLYSTITVFIFPVLTLAGSLATQWNYMNLNTWYQFYSILNIVFRMTTWREAVKSAVEFKSRDLLQKLDQFNQFIILDLIVSFVLSFEAFYLCTALTDLIATTLILGTALYMILTRKIYYQGQTPVSIRTNE